eukprot:2086580-Prymnesium_polylepis.1
MPWIAKALPHPSCSHRNALCGVDIPAALGTSCPLPTRELPAGGPHAPRAAANHRVFTVRQPPRGRHILPDTQEGT